MPRAGLDTDMVIATAARMTNEFGIEQITLKMIAAELDVQTPSLYNHIKSFDELKRKLMIYGWKQMEEQLVQAVIGVSGEEAAKAMCKEFYAFATGNSGLFDVMLWYNKFQDEETMAVTERLFDCMMKVFASMGISEQMGAHFIRTFRSFLEGYCLLLNRGAFGNAISTQESFEMSVNALIAGIRAVQGNETK